MRQVVIDTETTGLSPAEGERIIEIGCVEIVDRKIGATWQAYLNPEGRASHPMALKKHGLTDEFLADKPLFGDVKFDFWNFLTGADELIAFNAAFDVAFLDAEIARLGSKFQLAQKWKIVDARELAGGGSLDRLLDRFNIDRSSRTLHGALLDAELLAQAYLAMTRGNEELSLAPTGEVIESGRTLRPAGLVIPVVRPTPEEQAAHDTMMAAIRRTA